MTPGTHLADVHSHLVPGVDDGAPTLDDALEGIGRMRDAGIRRIVTTPHLAAADLRGGDDLDAWMEDVGGAWAKLSSAVARTFEDVELRRGSEIMLDVPDPHLDDERVRLGGGRFVLVEWPRMRVPPGTVPVVARIVRSGYVPVIAHPERYVGMGDDLSLADQWRAAGAFLQVNTGSLSGRYGPAARQNAFSLLAEGWADLLSTDFHGKPHLDLHVASARDRLWELGAEEQWRLLASVNPGRVMDGDQPLPVPPVSVARSFWRWVRGVFAVKHVARI